MQIPKVYGIAECYPDDTAYFQGARDRIIVLVHDIVDVEKMIDTVSVQVLSNISVYTLTTYLISCQYHLLYLFVCGLGAPVTFLS